MKKRITLMMIFVLSVGFLMAQGVFTYQTVVVDKTGKLVVNTPVTATVTISDADASTDDYVETCTGTTSLNGLLVLSVGNKSDVKFNHIDWATAKITVEYTDVAIAADAETRIPAVPYALQSDDSLTTQMIVDYISNPATTIEDVKQILDTIPAATRDAILDLIIDLVKANYQFAKSVFEFYVQNAKAKHADKLLDSLTSNTAAMQALMGIMVDALETPEGKTMVYEILDSYIHTLTAGNVDAIWKAVPDSIKFEIARQVFDYLTTTDAKEYLLKPVAKNYIQNISTTQMQQIINAARNNPKVYNPLLTRFTKWMDDYFAHHYSGGTNSQITQLVRDTIQKNYYECDTVVNLCELQAALEDAGPCFHLTGGSTGFDITFKTDVYTDTVSYAYGGTYAPTVNQLKVKVGSEEKSFPTSAAIIDNTNKTITLSIAFNDLVAEFPSMDFLTLGFDITLEIQGSYPTTTPCANPYVITGRCNP